jgi:hypothetical protein
MKKLSLSLSALCCLCACNVVSGVHDTANERYMREQNQAKAEKQLQEVAYAGGQPGKIVVNGSVVNENGNLDQRIKVSQRFGHSDRLQSQIVSAVEKKSAASGIQNVSQIISGVQATALPSSDRSYILVGCESGVDPAWIAELSPRQIQQQKAGDIISANTVVICGKHLLNLSKMEIRTHNLYLKDASLIIQGKAGAIVVTTDRLVLNGKNRIETFGLDAVSNVAPAPSLELNVLQGLFGDGSLKLYSQGGNCRNP